LISSVEGDTAEYAYTTSLSPAFTAAAGTQYWLSIVNDTTGHGSTWSWESGDDGDGELAFSHDGSPWQNFAADTAFELVTDRSGVGNPYLFTGRRYDPESGWYHYRTRYLDPETGRFTTRDTIGIWGDEYNLGNGYTYVGSNPWTYLDPFGLKVEWKKGPGATDADVAKAKKQWEEAKKRRNKDGSKPKGVENMEDLEERKDKTITIVVGSKGNSYRPKGWKCAMDPKKGTDGTIFFDPNKKGKMSDGTERDPESSLVHEATHAKHGADGKIAKTADGKVDRKAEEVKTTGVENEHRKAKGIPQRKKYGSWKVPQH
jgi:RHS repeat-associated protein